MLTFLVLWLSEDQTLDVIPDQVSPGGLIILDALFLKPSTQ